MDDRVSPGQRILGIDPGLNVTGYGVLEVTSAGGLALCEAGVIRGTPRASLARRVHEIYRGVADLVAAFRPAVLALEQLYSHYKRPRTAILMGHARGVICLAAAEKDVPVEHYPATRIKKLLTGNGRAPKAQMQRVVQRELGLAALPEPADVADALAIAMGHYYARKTLALVEAALRADGSAPRAAQGKKSRRRTISKTDSHADSKTTSPTKDTP